MYSGTLCHMYRDTMHVKGQSYVVHWTITMHVQKVNPIGHNISSKDQSMGTRYMNLWGQDACTNASYGGLNVL